MATYTPPASIDRTGNTPVAMLLNEWLNGHYTSQGGLMHPDGADSRWAGDAGQYPTGAGLIGAGIPDGSTIQWPANSVFNIDDYELQFTGELLIAGNPYQNGRIRRNMNWIMPDTCWFIRSDARLDGGPGTPGQLINMVHFEELEYLIVNGMNIRGVKPQDMKYDAGGTDTYESQRYESPARNCFFGVSMRRYEITNAKILHPLCDCILVASRSTDKLIFFSCNTGTDIINLTGENNRVFDADDVGRILLTGGNQAYGDPDQWMFDAAGDSFNRYGAPAANKASRTTTAFPVMANSATYAEWPRIIAVLSPTQARINMHPAVTRGNQKAHITIRIGPGGTSGWDSSFGGNVHDNYTWDAGREDYTMKAHVPDGGIIENVSNIVNYVADRHCDIYSNVGLYPGQGAIDSLEDSFGNNMPNPHSTPGGNEFAGYNYINQFEDRPSTGPIPQRWKGKNFLAYPCIGEFNATPVPWLSKVPSYTAHPIDWSDQSRILFKGPNPTAPVSMTPTTARFEFSTTKRPVYIVLAVSKRKVGAGLGTAPGDDYHTYAGVCDNIATNHCFVNATGLTPYTIYHYIITATGAAGVGDFVDTPASWTFWTPAGGGGTPVPAPTISGFAVQGAPTGSSIVLHFTTNTNGDSGILWKVQGSAGPYTPVSLATQTTNHTVSVNGLAPDTDYEFLAVSTNTDDNSGFAGPIYATTDDISVVGPFAYGGAAIMTADTTSTSVRVLFFTTGGPFGNGLGSTTVAYAVVGSPSSTLFVDDPALTATHDVTITGLSPGVQYVITISSKGADGTQLGPVFLGPVTTLTTGTSLVFGGFAVDRLTNTSARFRWTTDRPGTSQVSYGLAITPLDSALVLNHSVVVTGLAPATFIGALARSKDSSGFESISGTVVNFTTLPAPAPNPTPVVERFNTPFTTLPSLSSAFGTGTDDFIVAINAAMLRFTGQLTTGATRKAYWPSGVAALLNGEVRSRWAARSGIEVQHGHVHRLTGAGPFRFVTITRNIFLGVPEGHNINAHYWDTDYIDPLTGFAAPFHTDPFSSFPVSHLLNVDLPWNVKSRTIGPYLDFAAWLDADPEPAYSNATFGARFEIPVASTCRSTPGVHGFYMGHNLPGTTSDVDNFIVNELGAGAPVGVPGIQVGSLHVIAVTETTATIGWTTLNPSDSQVIMFGAPVTPVDAAPVTDHAFTAVGLVPATSYTAYVRSANASGIEVV